MSQFKRKADSGETPASGSQEPDFSALEAPTGFTAGQVDHPGNVAEPNNVELPSSGAIARPAQQPAQAAPEPLPNDVFGPTETQPAQPVEAAPKKHYYNPGEVMKKKGCIGCGGMVLVAPLLLGAIAALAVAIH